MKKLMEMAPIVKTVKISKSDILLNKSSSNTRVDRFFNFIVAGKFKSDQEAAMFFFNESSTSHNYKNLKRYLKQKMYNSLFFVEPNKNYGEFNANYLFCAKRLFLAKILLNLGARNSGIDNCRKVFKKALDVELSEFVVESSRYLRLHFGSRLGDKEKFEYYNQVYHEHLQILEAERLAEEYYILLTLPLVKSVTIEPVMIQNANDFYNKLQPYLAQYPSPVLHFYGNYIKILGALFKNDYTSLITYCKNAISFFEEKDYMYANPLRVFYHNLLIGYTQLKQYQAGKEAVERASQLVLSGTHSWYANKELHLILAFHSREYLEVYKILDSVYSHKKFKLLDDTVKEKWNVYKAYAFLYSLIGKVDIRINKLRNFRLSSFLNDVVVYSRDKRGLNIPILIIQIVILIIRKDYSKTIDRFDAIKKYVSRHIRKGQNFRSHCFMNMLLELPASCFNKAAVLRRTQVWHDKLKANPLELAHQPHEIEIIPYEDLWEYVLDSLA